MPFRTSILVIAVAMAAANVASAQDEGAATSFGYVGITECARCHDRILFDSPDFVELDEFTKWFSADKHSRAYLRIVPDKSSYDEIVKQFADLHRRVNAVKPEEHRQPLDEQWGASNELSAAMCTKLGIKFADFTNPASQGNTAKQCLSCHANWRTKDASPDPEVFKHGIGVGCESCHGPASAWKDPHDDKPWRNISPQEKQAKFGMVDVRNPIERGRQCFGCHIGNVGEGKVVTHAMYAAGHPPLPGIEVESFSEQMPWHWRTLDQKGDFEGREQFASFYRHDPKSNKYFAWQPGELARSRSVVLGGVMALRESTALLGQQAETQSPAWPPLESFACASCHHELRTGQPGTQVRFANKPGRPPLHYWTPVLVKLGFASLMQGEGELTKRLDSWNANRQAMGSVLNRTPFGVPSQIANDDETGAADNVVKALDGLLADIQSAPFDKRAARRSLEMLLGLWPRFFEPEKEIIDFHGARQAGWALRVFYEDLKQVSKAGAAAEPGEIEDAVPSPFEMTLKKLAESLRLDMPAGASGNLTSQLPQAFDAMNEFQLSSFFELMGELREAWPMERRRLEQHAP